MNTDNIDTNQQNQLKYDNPLDLQSSTTDQNHANQNQCNNTDNCTNNSYFGKGAKIIAMLNRNKTYIDVSTIILFGWEHFFRLNGSLYRPTIGVNYVTDKMRLAFKFVGSCIANLSGFLTWVNFKELKTTCSDMSGSVFDFSTSFMYTLYGYYEQSKEYIGEQRLVYFGSVLLVIGLCYVYRYFYYKNSKNSDESSQ